MTTRYFTGIGSRETPDWALELLYQAAFHLARQGWIGRSGNAQGADAAVEDGIRDAGGHHEIMLPWPKRSCEDGIIISDDRVDPALLTRAENWIADKAEPRFKDWQKDYHNGVMGRKHRSAFLLHRRNAFQITGPRLDTPSRMTLAYTAGAKYKGGTRIALHLSDDLGIPVYNLGDQQIAQRIQHWVDACNAECLPPRMGAYQGQIQTNFTL